MNSGKRIDFVGKRKLAYILSASVLILGAVFIFIQQGLNYNIEFNGGYLMHAGFYEQTNIGDIRDALSTTELRSIQLQQFDDNTAKTEDFPTEVIIKMETMDYEIKNLENTITTALNNKFGDDAYQIRQSSSIGPKVGDELKSSTAQAIFWAILFILIYISIKFHFKYGVAAIIALFHDVAVTIGILSILGFFFDYEISLSVIAALLTIVGYSLNDTIVVFVRIRENIKKLEGMEFEKLVNVSLNETLSRTLLTSLTTLFVVLVLFLFGGEVIRGLSTTLLIGVIVGTYSSIFVASPAVIVWNKATAKKRRVK